MYFKMKKHEDKNTRYFIDFDLKERKILTWDYDQKDKLSQELPDSSHHRIFITKGQYNKLNKKISEVEKNFIK